MPTTATGRSFGLYGGGRSPGPQAARALEQVRGLEGLLSELQNKDRPLNPAYSAGVDRRMGLQSVSQGVATRRRGLGLMGGSIGQSVPGGRTMAFDPRTRRFRDPGADAAIDEGLGFAMENRFYNGARIGEGLGGRPQFYGPQITEAEMAEAAAGADATRARIAAMSPEDYSRRIAGITGRGPGYTPPSPGLAGGGGGITTPTFRNIPEPGTPRAQVVENAMQRAQARRGRLEARERGPSQLDILAQRNPAMALRIAEMRQRGILADRELGLRERGLESEDSRFDRGLAASRELAELRESGETGRFDRGLAASDRSATRNIAAAAEQGNLTRQQAMEIEKERSRREEKVAGINAGQKSRQEALEFTKAATEEEAAAFGYEQIGRVDLANQSRARAESLRAQGQGLLSPPAGDAGGFGGAAVQPQGLAAPAAPKRVVAPAQRQQAIESAGGDWEALVQEFMDRGMTEEEALEAAAEANEPGGLSKMINGASFWLGEKAYPLLGWMSAGTEKRHGFADPAQQRRFDEGRAEQERRIQQLYKRQGYSRTAF